MNTLGLTVQLCSLAVNAPNATQEPSAFLAKVKTHLISNASSIGGFIKCGHKGTEHLGSSIKVHTYEMRFENKVLEMQFTFYKPDSSWMIKAFKFI